MGELPTAHATVRLDDLSRLSKRDILDGLRCLLAPALVNMASQSPRGPGIHDVAVEGLTTLQAVEYMVRCHCSCLIFLTLDFRGHLKEGIPHRLPARYVCCCQRVSLVFNLLENH